MLVACARGSSAASSSAVAAGGGLRLRLGLSLGTRVGMRIAGKRAEATRRQAGDSPAAAAAAGRAGRCRATAALKCLSRRECDCLRCTSPPGDCVAWENGSARRALVPRTGALRSLASSKGSGKGLACE